jgi:FMN phosphatase YigB (HAD superfamily)
VRAIFFDASGVLFENGTARFIESLERVGCGQHAALEAIVSGPLSWALRRGEIEPDDFWHVVEDDVRRITGLATGAFRDRWIASFQPHQGIEALLSDLTERGHELGIIAETVKDRVDAIERLHPWTALPRRKFWSFDARQDKRDGALFRHAYRLAGRFAERPLMIEDDPASALRAEEAGFEAILFQDVERLRALLL